MSLGQQGVARVWLRFLVHTPELEFEHSTAKEFPDIHSVLLDTL